MRTIPSRQRSRLCRTGLAAVVALGLAAGAGCAPSTAPNGPAATASIPKPRVDDDFDLKKLVAAAKKEGSVTVYDSTGDIVEAAKAFTKKYGIKATGVKSKVGDTLEKMSREAQAGNVTIDLTLYEDGASFVGQLLPQKIVYTWLPGDLIDNIAAKDRRPPQVLAKANVFAYNPKVFGKGCPIHNIWDLTDPKWRGKVTMQDPLGKLTIVYFFSQMSSRADKELKAAYQEKYGKSLQTDEKTPALEWMKRLAKNSPILTDSDGDSSAAVGAPNQTKPRVGLFSIAKFRDVEDKGYHLRACKGMQPWVGYQYPKYIGIATKTPHPNAAKLFEHFMYTEKGIGTEMHNGGVSANQKVPPGRDLPGLTDWDTQLFGYDSSTLIQDYRNGETIRDLWRLSHN